MCVPLCRLHGTRAPYISCFFRNPSSTHGDGGSAPDDPVPTIPPKKRLGTWQRACLSHRQQRIPNTVYALYFRVWELHRQLIRITLFTFKVKPLTTTSLRPCCRLHHCVNGNVVHARISSGFYYFHLTRARHEGGCRHFSRAKRITQQATAASTHAIPANTTKYALQCNKSFRRFSFRVCTLVRIQTVMRLFVCTKCAKHLRVNCVWSAGFGFGAIKWKGLCCAFGTNTGAGVCGLTVNDEWM